MQIMERRHLLIWLHNSNRTIWQNVGTFLIGFKSSFRDANRWFHFPHVICRVSVSRAVLDKMTYIIKHRTEIDGQIHLTTYLQTTNKDQVKSSRQQKQILSFLAIT